MNDKKQNKIPVIDIRATSNEHSAHQDIIAEPFAEYLLVHPNFYKAHRHSFYHLVLFTRGSGYHTIDFEQFDVQKGSIYFMIPGQVHSWNFEGHTDGFVVNFSENIIKKLLADKNFLEQFSFFRGIAMDSVLQLNEQSFLMAQEVLEEIVQEAATKNTFSNEIIISHLLSLFIKVSRAHQSNLSLQEQHPGQLLLFQFRKLVEQYYHEKHLPKEYAALLYVTPNHLNAVCNDLLGKSAGTIIRDRILLEAKRYLVNAGQNIAEIAYQLGFSDNSYFTKFFRKYTGTTPEQFRQSALKSLN